MTVHLPQHGGSWETTHEAVDALRERFKEEVKNLLWHVQGKQGWSDVTGWYDYEDNLVYALEDFPLDGGTTDEWLKLGRLSFPKDGGRVAVCGVEAETFCDGCGVVTDGGSSCPYAEEINSDHSPCNCCDTCRMRCAGDI